MTEWICLPKSNPINKKYLEKHETYEHPLKQSTITVIESKGIRKLGSGSNASSRTSSTISLDPISLALDGTDPLSQFVRQQDEELIDPLSQMVAEYETSFKQHKKIRPQLDEDLPAWNSRKIGILNKFTTSEKLSITSSFLSGGEIIKTQSTVSDKVKYRLEQLDNFEDGSVRQMMNLTQQEYITKIEQLNQELVQSWNSDQRVKALKIAIQCSKMLSDTSVLQFYPSQFVLITDILDIFGKLVYERLRTKADYKEPGKTIPVSLPENFTPEMVSESAKETCQNWFYKIASIRELLPRIYVEMAILKSYNFLTQTEFNQALLRLTRMIRGIGDPLVGAYARCYLIRVGQTVCSDKEYMKESLQDFLFTYQTIFNGSIRSEINRQRIDIANYLALYCPALDWIFKGLAYRSMDIFCDSILNMCKEKKNNGLLLLSILTSFKSDYVSSRSLEFLKILSNSNTEGINKGQLLRSLGISLASCPPNPDKRLTVYSTAFTIINTLTNPNEYISCIEIWSQFVAENFGLQEINILLEDILSRLSQNRIYETYYSQLQSIIDKILRYIKDFEGLLILDNFLPFVDLFKKESVKIDVCKNIMYTYKTNFKETISDPVVTNTLMYICKILNDSVNALTVEDEKRYIGQLISNFIRNVDYEKDFEQQLNFYVESRAAFPNLDMVLSTLVYCVNNLAIKTRNIVNGNHTRKTAAFVKACAAYCFITIPSIVSIIIQMDLYMLSGQIALLNLCFGQADSCFAAALNLVAELPRTVEIEGKLKSTENYLVNFLCNMLSELVVVPDSPDQGVLFLVRLLTDVLKRYPFDLNSQGSITVYLHILDLLYIQNLEVYPYHIPNVISNDQLYGSDPKFITEINNLCSQIVDQILIKLKSLGDASQTKLQTNFSLELFIRIIRYANLNKDKMFTLAINLWTLCRKNSNSIDSKILQITLNYVEQCKTDLNHLIHAQRLCDLINKMKDKM